MKFSKNKSHSHVIRKYFGLFFIIYLNVWLFKEKYQFKYMYTIHCVNICFSNNLHQLIIVNYYTIIDKFT